LANHRLFLQPLSRALNARCFGLTRIGAAEIQPASKMSVLYSTKFM